MCLTANQMMYISAHKIEPTKNFLLDHELTKIRLNLFQKLKNIEMVLVKVDPLKSRFSVPQNLKTITHSDLLFT